MKRSGIEHPTVQVDASVEPWGALSRYLDTHGFEHLAGIGAVTRLEAALCAHFGMKYAVATSNATMALWALANAIGARGKKVIVPALTWGGTVAGSGHAGACVVFADVDARTLTLDPEAVCRVLAPHTHAIVAVDYCGVPADDVALRRIADEEGLWYIHDAAQSFGAQRLGRPSGTSAHAVVVSFGPGKAIRAGEGGAIVTNDRDVYESLVVFTQHPSRQKRDVGLRATELGLNLRINPVAAELAARAIPGALARVREHQHAIRPVVDSLDESGLVQPLNYSGDGLAPSFHSTTAAWRRASAPAELTAFLSQRGHSVSIEQAGMRPVYQDPGARMFLPDGVWRTCPVAEDQASRRFVVRPVLTASSLGQEDGA